MEKVIASLKKIIPQRLLSFARPAYHFTLAFLGALFYWFPSRHIVVIGVTGTKGKTTTVELITSIFEESGARVASLSSLRVKIGDEEIPNIGKMTMPGRFFIQKFLRDAVRKKCSHAVLEVTSQGIAQFRHRFITFRTGLMTNIAPEHLEAHGGFENYLRAKLDLFWRLPKNGFAIINEDDPYRDRFAAATIAERIFYGKSGLHSRTHHWAIHDASTTGSGIHFRMGGMSGQMARADDVTFISSLKGEFNFSNILGVVAVGLTHHIPLKTIAVGITRVAQIPGRMEWVCKEPFAVVVDYAHTPNSLREVYRTLSPKNARLICVLGSAGGGRDKWKRPEFGKIAAEFCSEVLLTNEDPYDEDPSKIISEIAAGIPKTTPPVLKIVDRREAIQGAISLAKKGDVVILTGKGSESYIMGPHGTKIPWNEVEVTLEELSKLKT